MSAWPSNRPIRTCGGPLFRRPMNWKLWSWKVLSVRDLASISFRKCSGRISARQWTNKSIFGPKYAKYCIHLNILLLFGDSYNAWKVCVPSWFSLPLDASSILTVFGSDLWDPPVIPCLCCLDPPCTVHGEGGHTVLCTEVRRMLGTQRIGKFGWQGQQGSQLFPKVKQVKQVKLSRLSYQV